MKKKQTADRELGNRSFLSKIEPYLYLLPFAIGIAVFTLYPVINVVLMRSGVLQQNDLPQRLYNEPANQFVADFLGNPPINNIPGSIQNGLFVTEDGKAEAKLPMLEGVENGRKVNFSVRSESFVLDEKGPIACEVTRMYQMGKEEMAYLRMGGHDFRAYIDADAGLKAGDHVRLGLKKRGVFLFDRETGERIR